MKFNRGPSLLLLLFLDLCVAVFGTEQEFLSPFGTIGVE